MRNNFWAKKNKFGAKKTEVDGIMFDSKAEAAYYWKLKLLKKTGEILDFERQVSFELMAYSHGAPVKVAKHKVDFLVTVSVGVQEVHEVKGYATDVWKLKQKIFEANYPSIKYVVVK